LLLCYSFHILVPQLFILSNLVSHAYCQPSGQETVVILKASPAVDAAVMSFQLSVSSTSSSSLTPFRPVVHIYHTMTNQIFSNPYILHPQLLSASNRSFSGWLPVMNYGWPSLFVHSGDMSIPFHSPFSYSILCYFLFCPYSHLRIAYALLTPYI